MISEITRISGNVYDPKVYFGYLYPFVIDLQIFKHILVKFFNTKFHPNPSSGSRTLSCGRTAWRTDMSKLIVGFRVMLMRIEISKMAGTLYMKTEWYLQLPHLFCIKADDIAVLDTVHSTVRHVKSCYMVSGGDSGQNERSGVAATLATWSVDIGASTRCSHSPGQQSSCGTPLG